MTRVLGLFFVLSGVFALGCINIDETKNKAVVLAEEAKKASGDISSSISDPEKFIAEGIVINTHVEYFHTIVGVKTKDNQLLNLIFPGIFMQFGPGYSYRITYHRLNDFGYLPELLRTQKANYYYLDNVEVLNNNYGAK